MVVAADEYAVLVDECLGGGKDGELSQEVEVLLRSAHFAWVENERKLNDWTVSLNVMSEQAAEGPPELDEARAAFQEAARQVEIDYNKARDRLARATALLEKTLSS